MLCLLLFVSGLEEKGGRRGAAGNGAGAKGRSNGSKPRYFLLQSVEVNMRFYLAVPCASRANLTFSSKKLFLSLTAALKFIC